MSIPKEPVAVLGIRRPRPDEDKIILYLREGGPLSLDESKITWEINDRDEGQFAKAYVVENSPQDVRVTIKAPLSGMNNLLTSIGIGTPAKSLI